MQIVETERMYLRAFTSDDLDALASMNADADVMRFIGDGKPQTLEQTQIRITAILDHRRRHGFGLCAMADKETGTFIGFCGLQYLDNTSEIELGYRLAKRFWGLGLASEGAKASLRFGFEELHLDRIVAVVQPQNEASQRVLEKSGLTYVKNARYYNTEVQYYAITREHHQRDGSTYIYKSES